MALSSPFLVGATPAVVWRFLSDTTFTPPVDGFYEIYCVGGGSGGGGGHATNNFNGGGAGGSAVVRGWLKLATTDSIAVNVGAGGTGGAVGSAGGGGCGCG